MKATQQFDDQTHGTHSKAKGLVEELVNITKVFQFIPNRKHASFSNVSCDFFLGLNEEKLLDWIKIQILRIIIEQEPQLQFKAHTSQHLHIDLKDIRNSQSSKS